MKLVQVTGKDFCAVFMLTCSLEIDIVFGVQSVDERPHLVGGAVEPRRIGGAQHELRINRQGDPFADRNRS